jgi:hypothetical protein
VHVLDTSVISTVISISSISSASVAMIISSVMTVIVIHGAARNLPQRGVFYALAVAAATSAYCYAVAIVTAAST